MTVSNIDVAFETLVQNSVFWGNDEGGVPTTGSEITRFSEATQTIPARIKVTFSDVQGNLPASMAWPLWVEDVIDQLPLFVDVPTNNFRVKENSPVLDDADTNTAIIAPDDFDLDGDSDFLELTPDLDLRQRDTDGDGDTFVFVDMGAYENFLTCCADVRGLDHTVNVTDLLAVLGTWGSCPAPCVNCTINTSDSCPADTNRTY